MRLAIINVVAEGSSYYMMNRIEKGLRKDGFKVNSYNLNSWLIHKLLRRDLSLLRGLKGYDAVLYGQSIAFLSPLLLDKCKLLFLHGFNYYDFYYTGLLHGRTIIDKLSGLGFYTWWSILRRTNSIDYYICHSRTSCIANCVDGEESIILPQFVFEEELDTRALRGTRPGNAVNILVYTSSSKYSPRLLSAEIITKIPRLLAKKLGERGKTRRINYTIVSPEPPKTMQLGNITVAIRPPMPRSSFQKLLRRQDIYIERNLDEELGLTSIEAGLNGAVVAKITLPEYDRYRDYMDDEVLNSSSLTELIDKLVILAEDIDDEAPRYVERFHDYLSRRRRWGVVKRRLYDKLSECIGSK